MTFKEYLKMEEKQAQQEAAAQQDEAVKNATEATAETVSETTEQASETPAENQPSVEDELKRKLMYLQAEFDNYRKRMARDRVDMIKNANEDLVESLLPVLDHIGHAELAMSKATDDSVKPFMDGFQMVKNELLKVLEGYGVKPIAATGAFDANLHEALSAMPAPTEASKPGDILFEVRRGYTLNGRVLRATQVIVVAEAEEPAPAPVEAEVEAPVDEVAPVEAEEVLVEEAVEEEAPKVEEAGV